MRDTARAAVMTAPGRIGVEEFPVPEPRDGAVLLRMLYSGICGTDKHTWRGETRQYAGTAHERDVEFPLICGHENVGLVAALPDSGAVFDHEGRRLKVGDRVVPGANVPCGTCYFCRTGAPYYFCEHLEDYGNSLGSARPPHLLGGWGEYLYVLPRTPIFTVPDELPSEVAALTELMSVTHGLETAQSLSAPGRGFRDGDSVAILGAGPLGLCHLIKANLLGAGRLIVVDLQPGRLRRAERLGATDTLHVSGLDPEERRHAIRELTDGRGADVVVDCTGSAEPFVDALRTVRFGGTVIEAGAFVDMGQIGVNPSADICARNLLVIGVGGETDEAYAPTLRMLTRALDRLSLRELVSHRVGLDDLERGLELTGTDAAMKVLVDPSIGAQR